MEELYVDQAIHQQRWPIRHFYTPIGIRRLDTRFMHRIMAFRDRQECVEYSYNYSTRPPTRQVENRWHDTFESLRKDIRQCPHLHRVIKKNLLGNLKTANRSRRDVAHSDSTPHTFLLSS